MLRVGNTWKLEVDDTCVINSTQLRIRFLVHGAIFVKHKHFLRKILFSKKGFKVWNFDEIQAV